MIKNYENQVIERISPNYQKRIDDIKYITLKSLENLKKVREILSLSQYNLNKNSEKPIASI